MLVCLIRSCTIRHCTNLIEETVSESASSCLKPYCNNGVVFHYLFGSFLIYAEVSRHFLVKLKFSQYDD